MRERGRNRQSEREKEREREREREKEKSPKNRKNTTLDLKKFLRQKSETKACHRTLQKCSQT